MADATWKSKPPSVGYNTAGDWTTDVVPGQSDTAFFGKTSKPHIVITETTDVGTWNFQKTAGHYSFTNSGAPVSFFGSGIVVHGGSLSIDADAGIDFLNASSAGPAHITATAKLTFRDTSTAGRATIDNKSLMAFFDSSSADHAKITNGDNLSFANSSSAGNAVITTENDATLTFLNTSDGGAAQIITQAGGSTDFSGTSGHNGNGLVSVGSIAGAGSYFLGDDSLLITSNHSTTVSGSIEGGTSNSPAEDGELVKQGTGTLTLSHENGFVDAVIDTGTLDVAAPRAAGQEDIEFKNDHLHETLKIENAALNNHQFQTLVEDFHASDIIDFAGLKFVKGAHATLDNTGELSVKSGKVTDSLELNLAKFDHLKVVSDGHNGTEVVAMNASKEKAVASADGDRGDGYLYFHQEIAQHDFIL